MKQLAPCLCCLALELQKSLYSVVPNPCKILLTEQLQMAVVFGHVAFSSQFWPRSNPNPSCIIHFKILSLEMRNKC